MNSDSTLVAEPVATPSRPAPRTATRLRTAGPMCIADLLNEPA